MSTHSRTFEVSKHRPEGRTSLPDQLAVEEPLQVVIDGRPLAVLMRTPGDDEVLVLGFMLTEGIISKSTDVVRIDLEARDNHALVFLTDDHPMDWERLTRHLFSASSCGLCGKATIDAILQSHPPVDSTFSMASQILLEAPTTMRKAQDTFESTGGLHASAIFDSDGKLLTLHEDIGRHNALDKVIGHSLESSIDLSNSFLLVSGRISFELMQKSLAAGIPLIAGISAPSSLAVEFASDSGQTLIGFLRPPTFNIYHGGERLKE
ncbi:formate dehydrogenase accessory sulfurtransferase FdhD [Akkermansiaceae bacterium]|nr:formate dehydrogenase accessory sulfurtransferase FdhD [Akkermansiaceae bacterium]MDB4288893.1 formate dehydrogenase accessory sulfurtransferase FdhD [bacterium]MDA8992000.1 formate dehydrogenase accessory sulfurtransferase FdhD [Akkermansiaceae bacterium]MDB4041777.1 formate dehydrogenase accessory sulfurtransferase FdhD [Akkermansiaceae bacterium]MDB4143486.1 formate dehydrogenase accessory sulfurtransferase FdhD [Akkermansiaceae bacterium]